MGAEAMKPVTRTFDEDQFVLVPREPTPAMSAAGFIVSEGAHDPAAVYRAMIAAAPAPQQVEGETPYITPAGRCRKLPVCGCVISCRDEAAPSAEDAKRGEAPLLTAEGAQEAVDHFNDPEMCPLLPPRDAYRALEAIASGRATVVATERLNKLALDRATARGEALAELTNHPPAPSLVERIMKAVRRVR